MAYKALGTPILSATLLPSLQNLINEIKEVEPQSPHLQVDRKRLEKYADTLSERVQQNPEVIKKIRSDMERAKVYKDCAEICNRIRQLSSAARGKNYKPSSIDGIDAVAMLLERYDAGEDGGLIQKPIAGQFVIRQENLPAASAALEEMKRHIDSFPQDEGGVKDWAVEAREYAIGFCRTKGRMVPKASDSDANAHPGAFLTPITARENDEKKGFVEHEFGKSGRYSFLSGEQGVAGYFIENASDFFKGRQIDRAAIANELAGRFGIFLSLSAAEESARERLEDAGGIGHALAARLESIRPRLQEEFENRKFIRMRDLTDALSENAASGTKFLQMLENRKVWEFGNMGMAQRVALLLSSGILTPISGGKNARLADMDGKEYRPKKFRLGSQEYYLDLSTQAKYALASSPQLAWSEGNCRKALGNVLKGKQSVLVSSMIIRKAASELENAHVLERVKESNGNDSLGGFRLTAAAKGTRIAKEAKSTGYRWKIEGNLFDSANAVLFLSKGAELRALFMIAKEISSEIPQELEKLLKEGNDGLGAVVPKRNVPPQEAEIGGKAIGRDNASFAPALKTGFAAIDRMLAGNAVRSSFDSLCDKHGAQKEGALAIFQQAMEDEIMRSLWIKDINNPNEKDVIQLLDYCASRASAKGKL